MAKYVYPTPRPDSKGTSSLGPSSDRRVYVPTPCRHVHGNTASATTNSRSSPSPLTRPSSRHDPVSRVEDTRLRSTHARYTLVHDGACPSRTVIITLPSCGVAVLLSGIGIRIQRPDAGSSWQRLVRLTFQWYQITGQLLWVKPQQGTSLGHHPPSPHACLSSLHSACRSLCQQNNCRGGLRRP